MNFKKLPGIKGGSGGCACCGYQHEHLSMTSVIGVGFGYAAVTKNGEEVYNERETVYTDKEEWTVQDAENEALKDPDNDWRIHLEAPLSERHYQRQGEGLWVLYKKGMGFA